MSDEANARNSNSANPMELWKQWYDSSTRMWSNLMEGGKESYIDPYGLYHSWLKGVNEATGQVKDASTAPPFSGLDIQELWKQWFDATTQVWRKATETGADPSGLTSQWLKLMEESRARLMAGEAGDALPTDPFSFFKQWYDATSESWSRIVGARKTADSGSGAELPLRVPSCVGEAGRGVPQRCGGAQCRPDSGGTAASPSGA